MAKTITVRLDDQLYDMFKKAATGEHRTISNFIEWATLAYLTNEMYVDDKEMNEIRKQAASLRKGLSDVSKGNYTIVK